MRNQLLQPHKRFITPLKTAGFTLVETLVAISVLLLIVIGPMTIAQKGIQNAYFANDQLTAVFLAQEAVESVRTMRDNAALDVYHDLVDGGSDPQDGDSWVWINTVPSECALGIGDDVGNFDGCTFDVGTGELVACGNDNGDCRLRMSEDGAYTLDPGDQLTPFTRKIYVRDVPPAAEVIVEVRWNASAFGGNEKNASIKTWLYDQYRNYEES